MALTQALREVAKRGIRGGGWRYAFDLLRFRLQRRKVPCWPTIARTLRGKTGIEIAGPTLTFADGGPLPVYSLVGGLSNYGFSAAPDTFQYGARIGRSTVCDAKTLPLADESCDFVLSSHVIEHLADPLTGLKEWSRVLRRGGSLLLLLPEGRRTFDRYRPVTSWEHLLTDFERRMPESDTTHLAQAVNRTDTHHWSFEPWDGWQTTFADNAKHRAVHHHVFDMALTKRAVSFVGLRALCAELVFPFHIVLLATKE